MVHSFTDLSVKVGPFHGSLDGLCKVDVCQEEDLVNDSFIFSC